MITHPQKQSMLGRHEADPAGSNAMSTRRRKPLSPAERQAALWEKFTKKQRLSGAFQRGVNDCCTWAATWAAMVCGAETVAGDWLGKPLSDDEALAIIAEHGGLEGAVDEALLPLGWQRFTPPPDAPKGSIVLIDSHGGFAEHSLGIVHEHCVLVRSEPKATSAIQSLTVRTVPLNCILKAWVFPD